MRSSEETTVRETSRKVRDGTLPGRLQEALIAYWADISTRSQTDFLISLLLPLLLF